MFLSLIVGLSLLPLVSCSKKEEESAPEVTVQAAKVERQSLHQVIRTEAVLYPKNQAAITPKIIAPVKTFYVNRGSRVQAGQLLAVLENRDLAAAETDTRGSYHQAEA
ncbi:MAG TPA: biotin/lipoyl-binding protein, partial [Candidatus Angelobacter sp.]|nr:biotin/lipoyl-binding protein [Candidatus Angelobacter sp.]